MYAFQKIKATVNVFRHIKTFSAYILYCRASQVIQKPQVNDLDVDAAIRSWKKAIDQLGADLASKETEDDKAGKTLT